MKHYRVEIEYMPDDESTECDESRGENVHNADYYLQAYSNDDAHIGDAWICARHLDDGMADLDEKARSYA